MQRPLTLLALTALAFTGLNTLRKKHYERLANMPKAKPEALQTWEGEGGGLPDGGPGQSVKPTASQHASLALPRRDDEQQGSNVFSPARDPAF